VRFVHDTIDDQVRELISSRDPGHPRRHGELDRLVADHIGGNPLAGWGTWIYLPWSARLVHILPRDEYRELRSDRNRHKITLGEQERLRRFRIGVIGLSVGNMAAVTLALEGIGGFFRLADFDRLSLSNLNRLRAGAHQIGIDKTVLAAREMLEIDPYLDIEVCPRGLQPDNIDAFLTEGGALHLVIEECDDLYVKLAVRERARALGIPVVMDTSDRGLLDIERFDLEPERPLFHGLIGDMAADRLRGLKTDEKIPYVLAIVDQRQVSTRMAASLVEVKQTISTWPQLASNVALGGAVTADIVRRILLDEHRESGRYYLDPEAIVAAGKGLYTHPVAPVGLDGVSPEALAPPALPREPLPGAPLDEQAIRWLVAMGTLAPSAHNAQPWRFRFHDGRLECWHDPQRDLPNLDFEGGATALAFGALCETVEIAARHIGWSATTLAYPSPGTPALVASIGFDPRPPTTDVLFPLIDKRVTNRRFGSGEPLEASVVRALEVAAASGQCRLQLKSGPASLGEIAALVGAGDRICILNSAIHHDAMHGYRWSRESVEALRDGLDVNVMEMSRSDLAGLSVISQWRVAEFLGQLGGGRALETLGAKTIASASAVGLLSIQGTDRTAYFAAGRAVQRLWLTATSRGVALHPMTGLPYLFARLERGGGEGLAPHERRELTSLRERYRRLFETSSDWGETFLFRLSIADQPRARSLRRKLDDVLTID
jgi:tRNA A37 threonylcarbamoyladenosine dehydratase/nitroreductase